MEDQFTRTRLLLGDDSIDILMHSHVAVFGIGGVGGYVCEALARSGVGAFDLVDSDTVSLTNLNRQIIATVDTVGRPKTQVMKERMRSINPGVNVKTWDCFFLPENADSFPFETYDYVIDAVDTVTAKIELVLRSQQYKVPVISAMGAGNRLDPSGFLVSDLFETEGCPLARVMRRELRKRGVEKLKVVYSKEEPVKPKETSFPSLPEEGSRKHSVPGSNAWAPAAAGLCIAAEVVRDLTGAW